MRVALRLGMLAASCVGTASLTSDNSTVIACSFVGILCERPLRPAASSCYGRCDLGAGGAIYLPNTEQAGTFAAGDHLELEVEVAMPTAWPMPVWAREHRGYTIRRVIKRRLASIPQRRRLSTVGSTHGVRSVLTICMLYAASAQQCNVTSLEDQLWGVTDTGAGESVSVADVLNFSSYGLVTFSHAASLLVVVDMAGAIPPQHSLSTLSCTSAQVEQVAIARARLDPSVVLTAYDHVEYILPNELATECEWCGLGTIGTGTSWITCADVSALPSGATLHATPRMRIPS